MSTEPSPQSPSPFSDPSLRKQLEDFVRRRVPQSDVDDVVQTVLVEALAAKERPTDSTELKKWVLGIARHKVVDFHRRSLRELAAEIPDIETSPPPIEERELARWAEEQAGSTRDAQRTLEWMAREGEGEKLETIAAEEQIPAARVRQRVSRMRRWMKERWVAELAAVATLTVLAFAAWWLLREHEDAPVAKPDKPVPSDTATPPAPPPVEVAKRLRQDALDQCNRNNWQPCLDGLDKAAELDPAGDTALEVGAARAKAKDALTSPPPTSTAVPLAPTSAPSSPLPTKSESSTPSTSKPTTVKPTPTTFSDGSTGAKQAPKGKKGAPKKALDDPFPTLDSKTK